MHFFKYDFRIHIGFFIKIFPTSKSSNIINTVQIEVKSRLNFFKKNKYFNVDHVNFHIQNILHSKAFWYMEIDRNLFGLFIRILPISKHFDVGEYEFFWGFPISNIERNLRFNNIPHIQALWCKEKRSDSTTLHISKCFDIRR